MSMSRTDDDGFQLVTSKRFSKNKPTKLPPKNIKFEISDTTINVDKVVGRIKSCVETLRLSSYWEKVSEELTTLLKSREVKEIVCFGVGQIGECNISRYQLSLLLCLKDHFLVSKVLVHDPIFSISECKVLRQLGLEIIEQNQEGDYIISDKHITIAYLPHCPKQLTNNFLWSNWSLNLSNCILICNSFTSLIENQPSRILSETVPYIYKIFPHTTEIELENNFQFTDIFNDTSIHYFMEEKLSSLGTNFWIKDSKPVYEDSEEFITSLMVEKLNI